MYYYIDDDVVIGDKNFPRNTFQSSRKFFHSINIRHTSQQNVIKYQLNSKFNLRFLLFCGFEMQSTYQKKLFF